MTSDEKSFREDLQRLNALCGPVWHWEPTKARKEHTDNFDAPIRRGETYFKKTCGVGYGDDIKLSRTSMETVLFAVIGSNPFLQMAADRLVESEARERAAAANNINL
jgi:hypothetical protein